MLKLSLTIIKKGDTADKSHPCRLAASYSLVFVLCVIKWTQWELNPSFQPGYCRPLWSRRAVEHSRWEEVAPATSDLRNVRRYGRRADAWDSVNQWQ